MPDTGRSCGIHSEVAAQVGSSREATWIIEYASTEAGGDGHRTVELARELAARRGAGEPLQYVLGLWSFRNLELVVDPRVLIPRPETEQVVEVALGHMARMAFEHSGGRALVGADLGTGSGAIALSLAAEVPIAAGWEIWATDASTDALDVARVNVTTLVAERPEIADRVHLVHGSWFAALPRDLMGRLDLVVSNPPYVATHELDDLDPEVREWEPRSALVAPRGASGVAGMADIESVIAGAGRWLRPGGALVVELDPRQAYAAVDAARRAGFSKVGTARDLAGRLRMLEAVR
jgi:release factor glutamine methyltransferase